MRSQCLFVVLLHCMDVCFLVICFVHIAQLYLGGGDFLGFGVVFSFFCLLGFVLGGVVIVCCACEVDGSSCFCGWWFCNLNSYCELFSFI